MSKESRSLSISSVTNLKFGTSIKVQGLDSKEDTDELVDDKIVNAKQADVTLELFKKYEEQAGELTPELEARIKRKLWLIILPILFFVNFILFLDKNAFSYAALLGLFEDANLTQSTYNDIQTYFYVGYLLAQIPSHYIFQRIKLSWYITGVTAVWTITTFSMLAAKNYKHLIVIRFFLGFSEAGVTPCIQHTIAMWFPPVEQAFVNPIFWISTLSQGVTGGLIAYGTLHVETWRPWKVYWTIIGGLSIILSISSYLFYPDNPATYKYFTVEERIHVIKRIKAVTNSSIEQKTVKRYQVVEALKDPITYLFGLFVFFLMLCQSLGFQTAIIYKNLGFSNLQSTLVSVAQSGWSVLSAIAGSLALVKFKTQSAHVGSVFSLFALLGGLLAVSVPLNKPYGILAGTFLTAGTANTFIMGFSWSQSSAAGYSKKIVRTIAWSIGYCISSLVCPHFWRQQDAPRYYLAWIIQIIGCWVLAPLTLQIIRFILNKRNKQRRQYIQDIEDGKIEDEYGFVTTFDSNGDAVKTKVDISMLDLTDLENKKFIYPL
ncbi:putative membrane protein [Wickerhamomyces ciferrii]|uniref:Membrane protein n=1 Tax=Wickerhamomyces ciferrii (strain ATCC 14091 / BCRC 22168 / CBS 111 / JCM 3599 / NBRC 0793 / NRRL Y-1031 F-60-10) TaxID=1206466 RepID=K0KVA6_WICCF|nr:uncharacterized protein BN7_4951 [Wickerhamomyces ciferrii]CCH45369.1 putative membrane protein [Wickerhamomyces ciferrii]